MARLSGGVAHRGRGNGTCVIVAVDGLESGVPTWVTLRSESRVSLIFEVVATGDAPPLEEARKQFGVAGGTIGRARHSDWVLPHNKVSSRHARVSFEHSTFYIEDTSTNGIYLNSPDNRLDKGRLYPLHAGDRLFIEPYEITVSVSSDLQETRLRPRVTPAAPPRLDADPFEAPALPRGLNPPAAGMGPLMRPSLAPEHEEVDPLKLLGGGGSSAPPEPRVASALDLESGPLLGGHFQPPPVRVPPPAVVAPPPPAGVFIPENYDPLAPETRSFPLAEPPVGVEPVAGAGLDLGSPVVAPASGDLASEEPPWMPPAVSGAPLADLPPLDAAAEPRPAPPRRVAPPPRPRVPTPAAAGSHEPDLAQVLAAAGLGDVAVTPELLQKFGQILRVVVQGLMDVLRSRHQVKDEFRMRMTVVRPVDNNPLKLSANVDDALHNLLVKRNPAYLGPVEAFQDAFDDLRRHQLAMLAGMRVAFEHALAEFDAERLRADFERQIRKSSVFPIGAKLRYWDLYTERQQELARDPEGTFRRLFGDAFTRAYEEQMKRLKDEQGRE